MVDRGAGIRGRKRAGSPPVARQNFRLLGVVLFLAIYISVMVYTVYTSKPEGGEPEPTAKPALRQPPKQPELPPKPDDKAVGQVPPAIPSEPAENLQCGNPDALIGRIFQYDKNAPVDKQYKHAVRGYMMHVPKCGGTAFSSVVRRVMCELNEGDETVDCCNPGLCDVWTNRSCKGLAGCTGHVPNIPQLDNPDNAFSFTLIREPISRALSGYFYRCHNPNEDCYHVNEKFCPTGKMQRCKAADPPFVPWTFEQYVDQEDYQNIYTRMAGANKFPYTENLPMDDTYLAKAKATFEKFSLVGMQEAFAATVLAIHHIAGTEPAASDFEKVRSQMLSWNHSQDKEARARYAAVLKDKSSELYKKMAHVHRYDVQLYEHARTLFCEKIRGFEAEVGECFWRKDLVEGAKEGFEKLCGSA